MDPGPENRHSADVTNGPSQIKLWLFRLVAAVWLATAIPLCLLSAVLLEVPLWPTFSDESTLEGMGLWAVIAAWFYITPVVLLVIGRRWNGRSTS
jgi:hypothetical protein